MPVSTGGHLPSRAAIGLPPVVEVFDLMTGTSKSFWEGNIEGSR